MTRGRLEYVVCVDGWVCGCVCCVVCSYTCRGTRGLGVCRLHGPQSTPSSDAVILGEELARRQYYCDKLNGPILFWCTDTVWGHHSPRLLRLSPIVRAGSISILLSHQHACLLYVARGELSLEHIGGITLGSDRITVTRIKKSISNLDPRARPGAPSAD